MWYVRRNKFEGKLAIPFKGLKRGITTKFTEIDKDHCPSRTKNILNRLKKKNILLILDSIEDPFESDEEMFIKDLEEILET
jgi:hypothetical protein